VVGVVSSFDEPRGLGEVTGSDGTRFPFHCTAIADGTRDIPLDTPVTFRVVAGHLGCWEATAIAAR